MPNKFHSLLASSTDDSLLKNLDLPKNEKEELENSAKEIRTAIIAGFHALRQQVQREHLEHEVTIPKFAIQGSYIYGTLNAPANPPKQQVDIDLGMYLPFSDLGNGQQPRTATDYYFNAVTSILEEYVAMQNKHWIIPPLEKQKPTCIRVVLNEKTHIDIPLYAVPEGEFNRVIEEAVALENRADYMVLDSILLQEAYAIDDVTPDVIHMAHREDGWLPSDALVIRAWIKSQFSNCGRMIRPVNRFLKAWRDKAWPEGGGPSSIFLLTHSLRSFPQDKDGLSHCCTLRAVIDELPNVFEQPLLVPCPTSENKNAKEDLCGRISPEDQKVYRSHFESFKSDYNRARTEDRETANETLISLFGERMPYDPPRIEVVNSESEKVDTIVASKPDVLPLYTTPRSNSG